MKCKSCGVEVAEGSVFCPKCGIRLIGAEIRATPSGNAHGHETGFITPAQRRSEIVNDPEAELWQGGFSPKAMYGSWLGAGLLTIALIPVAVFFPPAMIPVIAAVVLLWLGLLSYLVYRKMSVHYTLTNHRFVHQSGILVRATDRIEIIEIDDVAFFQGIIERMLGVGTIRITSQDRTHPELILPGIDDVVKISGMIDDARLKERRRRGSYLEQI